MAVSLQGNMLLTAGFYQLIANLLVILETIFHVCDIIGLQMTSKSIEYVSISNGYLLSATRAFCSINYQPVLKLCAITFLAPNGEGMPLFHQQEDFMSLYR